jgi:hypothetical protein
MFMIGDTRVDYSGLNKGNHLSRNSLQHREYG